MKKTYSKKGETVRVTFELPAEVEANSVVLVGEFNDWDKDAHPLTRRKDGRFSRTVSLLAGSEYRFRFWVDESRWENAWEADKYLPNEFGSEDSVVSI